MKRKSRRLCSILVQTPADGDDAGPSADRVSELPSIRPSVSSRRPQPITAGRVTGLHDDRNRPRSSHHAVSPSGADYSGQVQASETESDEHEDEISEEEPENDDKTHPNSVRRGARTVTRRRIITSFDVDKFAADLPQTLQQRYNEDVLEGEDIESLYRLTYLFGRIFGEDGRDNLRELLQYVKQHSYIIPNSEHPPLAKNTTEERAGLEPVSSAAPVVVDDDDVSRIVGAYKRQAAAGVSVLMDTCERSMSLAEFSRLFDSLVVAFRRREPAADRIIKVVKANDLVINGRRAETVVTDFLLFETQRLPLRATRENKSKLAARKRLHVELSLGRLYS